MDSTASAPWNPRFGQSHDLTSLNVAAEGQKRDKNVVWHQKQTDFNRNNSFSTTRTDGDWINSPHVNLSQHAFQEFVDDNKSVSPWPAVSGYSTPHSSKPRNDTMLDRMDTETKTEMATSYRLFGIDLMNHSMGYTQGEKVPLPSVTTEGHDLGTPSAADSDQKSDLSRASEEKKQEHLQVLASPKESQSRQSSTSTRSRTKVHKICLLNS